MFVSTCQNVHTHTHTDVCGNLMEIFPLIQLIVLNWTLFFSIAPFHFEQFTMNHSHTIFDNVLSVTMPTNVYLMNYLRWNNVQNESHTDQPIVNMHSIMKKCLQCSIFRHKESHESWFSETTVECLCSDLFFLVQIESNKKKIEWENNEIKTNQTSSHRDFHRFITLIPLAYIRRRELLSFTHIYIQSIAEAPLSGTAEQRWNSQKRIWTRENIFHFIRMCLFLIWSVFHRRVWQIVSVYLMLSHIIMFSCIQECAIQC